MSRSIEKTGDINDFVQRELETLERDVTRFDQRAQVAEVEQRVVKILESGI